MNQKTKDKIKAMAKERFKECSMPGAAPQMYKQGAKPFAEWCERFEKELYEMTCKYDRKRAISFLNEYRSWLEGKDNN